MKKSGDGKKGYREKMQGTREHLRGMSPEQTVKEIARFGMRLVTFGYLVFIAVLLPFYYKIETGYGAIGSGKSEFFRRWGFRFAWCMPGLFLIWLAAAYICRVRMRPKKVSGQPGLFSELVNEALDTFSVTDRFVIGYLCALGLSYYYTCYREAAFLGANGWYMGFLPQVVLCGSYFAVSRLLSGGQCRKLLYGMLAASFAVFLLGLLNRYQINPLGMEDAGPGFISTIGNINWYCGYWSALFPVGCGVFLLYDGAGDEKRLRIVKKTLLAVWCAVGFATGLTQGSESALPALAAIILAMGIVATRGENAGRRIGAFLKLLGIFCLVMIVLFLVEKCFPGRNLYITEHYLFVTRTPFSWAAGALTIAACLLYALRGKNSEKCVGIIRVAWRGCIIVTAVSITVFTILIVLNTCRPGSIGALSQKEIFTFDEYWGNSRGVTWKAGVRVFLSQNARHKLFGVGPDAMAEYLYSGENEELLSDVRERFGDARLTNAHGEWITVLADTGIFGILCFAGVMISAIFRYLRCDRENSAKTVAVACGLAVLSYTANNFFSFEQTMNVTQIYILLGLGENVMRQI